VDSLTELFCLFDDFYQSVELEWEKRLLAQGQKKRRRAASLSLSELMTPCCFISCTIGNSRASIFPTRYGFYGPSSLGCRATSAACNCCRAALCH
jgi:hypothetical protein